MMERIWSDILDRFGQNVTLQGEEETVCKALIQPWLERKTEQEPHGPLGLGRKDLFRYLGPPEYPVGLDTIGVWKGQAYRVQSAHILGEGICPYWWAVLYPRDEAAL